MKLFVFVLNRCCRTFIGITLLVLPAFFASVNAQSLSSIMSKYNGYDMDGNGTKEIVSFTYLPFEAPAAQEVPTDGRLVLVLVEPRLLQDITGSTYTKQDLLNRLNRWKGDLRAEGYYSRFIAASVYNGSDHQDGRTVLAIRKFLQEVRQAYPNLEGVTMVGSFPETMIIRDWLWRRERDTLYINNRMYTGVTYIQKRPEPIAHRTDIVLGDLDGNWQNLYVKSAVALPALVAIPEQSLPESWPLNLSQPQRLTSKAYAHAMTEQFQDFFYVKDARTDVVSDNGSLLDFWAYPNQHPELASADRSLKTPTAQPEIMVSRINTRHISFSIDPGSGLLDASGNPKSFTTYAKLDMSSLYKPDPKMERNLLIEYFDRNHMHRIGGYDHLPRNLASVDGEDFKAADQNNFMDDAATSWYQKKEYPDAPLDQYVDFVKYPAVVKGYRAHGSRQAMYFFKPASLSSLYSRTGTPYRWEVTKKQVLGGSGTLIDEYTYQPAFKENVSTADWNLHRTLWQNKKLTSVRPSFYFFFGCEANSPGSAETLPYNHVDYGAYNNAENILYFLNGLATMTRAKTFNDNMDGFPPELKKDIYSNLGNGWKAHYRHVAANTPSSNASHKRSYWWSVLGDWTLRLTYSNGAAILGFKPGKPDFEAKAVLADHTWIGSHTSAIGGTRIDLNTQTLLPACDLNNDLRDDFLKINDWGIGVAYHDGFRWQSLLAKPKDTWFGNWRYNASINTGSDKIEGHGDFDGNGTDDILIRSSWGMGILTYSSSAKTFTSLMANPAGTVYSDLGISWTYQTGDIIEAIADFNGDKRDDILIKGSKGRAVLMYLNGKLYPLMVVNYGVSSAGGGRTWLHESTDKMVGVADFSQFGTTKSILLMHATKGLGIMNASSSLPAKFLVQNIQPAGVRWGGWLFNPSDNKIEKTADFTKDGKDEIIITSAWGIGLLTQATSTSGTTFNSLVCKPRGTSFGAWTYSPTTSSVPDKIIGVGDFDADGAADILIQKPQYALGVLKLNTITASFDLPEIIYYNNSYLTKPIDGWYPKPNDIIVNIGNYDGLTGAEIFLYRRSTALASARTSQETEGNQKAAVEIASQVSFFPNPVQDFLMIQSRGAEIAFIQIYTITGNLVLSQSAGQKIDVSGLPSGMYVVQVKDGKGITVGSGKFIKQ